MLEQLDGDQWCIAAVTVARKPVTERADLYFGVRGNPRVSVSH